MKVVFLASMGAAAVLADERTLLTARSNADVPTFAQDHYYGSYESLAINQGGESSSFGTCCSATAPQCKVQVISMGGDHWNDAAHNRSRDDTQQGQIVNWYHYNKDDGKQMAIAFNQTVNAFQCEQFCPITGDLPTLEIGQYALHLGKHTVTQDGATGQTKSVDLYEWTDRIVIIPLDQNKFYVDESVSPPVPFYKSTLLEPFGQKIGTENTSYLGFVPGPVDQSKFNIVGIDSCPKSDNCNDNSYATPALKLAKSFLQQAEEVVAQSPVIEETESTPTSNNITFPNDWSAQETVHLVINQGGKLDPSGDLCCAHAVIGECQVQTQYQKGQKYFDYSNQRTRFEDAVTGEIIVNDYTSGKEMSVVHNETLGYDVCTEYCPLQDDLDIFGIDPDAKDRGASIDPISGQPAEHYHWMDVILKIIEMSHTEFYADISGDTAKPLSQMEFITPFGGPAIGSTNNTWANFTAGKQPADKFDIHGMDTCPQSPNCGQSSRQLHRIANRDYKTFAKYLKLLN